MDDITSIIYTSRSCNIAMKPNMAKIYDFKPMKERIIYFQEVILHSAVIFGIVTIEFVVHYYFKCPCINEDSIIRNCGTNNANNNQCKFIKNSYYSWAYICLPAIALFILGFVWNPEMWKVLSGKCYRGRWRGWIGFTCRCISETIFNSLVSPCAWLVITFLEGDYFACANSIQPYRGDCTNESSDDPLFSDEYQNNKNVSKLIGWIMTVVLSLGGILIFGIVRCCLTKSYYQDRHDILYREIEERKLEVAIRNMVDLETRDVIDNFPNLLMDDEMWHKIAEEKCTGRHLVDIINQGAPYGDFRDMTASNSQFTLEEPVGDYLDSQPIESAGFPL